MPRVQKKRRTQAEETSYTVGSLAKLAGVTVRALHHYEDEGLLHPERTASGYRRYGAADVERRSRFCCAVLWALSRRHSRRLR